MECLPDVSYGVCCGERVLQAAARPKCSQAAANTSGGSQAAANPNGSSCSEAKRLTRCGKPQRVHQLRAHKLRRDGFTSCGEG
eukprot:6753991-Prymnesium_polylepis.2